MEREWQQLSSETKSDAEQVGSNDSTEIGHPVDLHQPVQLRDGITHFSFRKNLDYEMRPVSADEFYELVVFDGPLGPAKFNTTRDNGHRGWATGDLWSPCPGDDKQWRLVGRADDLVSL